MSLRSDVFEHSGNDTVHIDDIGDARSQLCKQKIGDRNVIKTSNFFIGIDQQIKKQLLFLAKLPVRFGVIQAYTQDHCLFGFELLVQIAEPASLRGSARSAVFREKIQDDIFAAFEIGQSNFPPVLILGDKIGSYGSRLEHASLPLLFYKYIHPSRGEELEPPDPRRSDWGMGSLAVLARHIRNFLFLVAANGCAMSFMVQVVCCSIPRVDRIY